MMRRIFRGILPIIAAAMLGLLVGPADMSRAASSDTQAIKPGVTTEKPIAPTKPATTSQKVSPAAKPVPAAKIVPAAKPTKKAPVVAKPQEIDHGHVYLLRGLANIWSRGMDKFGAQLTPNGIRWSIHNHRKWKELGKEAAEKYKADKSFGPIIIVGHSLGADAAVLMAEEIGEAGVPVRLIVTFDGVARQNEHVSKVSPNVVEVLNFYKSNGWGREMIPAKGFKGKIDNVDLRGQRKVGHMNIDKSVELQARVLSAILTALNEKPVQSARN
jgi:hypothetical protein